MIDAKNSLGLQEAIDWIYFENELLRLMITYQITDYFTTTKYSRKE